MIRSFNLILLSLLLGGLVGTGCTNQHAPDRPPQEIKILTWNIYHGEQHYTPGQSNLEAIAKVINEHAPDVVAFQEVDRLTGRSASVNHGVRQDLVQELAAMTGMHGYFAQAMEYDGGGYGEGILSRHPAEPAIHLLPIPHGGEPRVLVMINSTLPDGRPFTFAGTHLCHEFEANQLAQVEAIMALVNANQMPMVVAGDFNFTPAHAPYAIIAQGMRDTAALVGNTRATWPYHAPEERLDYIFVDHQHPWVVKDVSLIDTDASDHFPVLAVLGLGSVPVSSASAPGAVSGPGEE